MVIRSRSNARLKEIRRLRRQRGPEAILEGPHLVAEALAADHSPESVLMTPEFAESRPGQELAAALSRPPLLVEDSLLAEITDSTSPRGVLAVTLLHRGGAEALPCLAGGVYLYLDQLQDPGNLGALARVAEAAGAVGLALSPGSANPNHPRALRASAGSLLRLPTAVGVEAEALSEYLADLQPVWTALAPRGGENLYQAPMAETAILVLGAEGPGVSAALEARATSRLTIPMAEPVESLNVTVAAALVLFERRRLQEAGSKTT